MCVFCHAVMTTCSIRLLSSHISSNCLKPETAHSKDWQCPIFPVSFPSVISSQSAEVRYRCLSTSLIVLHFFLDVSRQTLCEDLSISKTCDWIFFFTLFYIVIMHSVLNICSNIVIFLIHFLDQKLKGYNLKPPEGRLFSEGNWTESVTCQIKYHLGGDRINQSHFEVHWIFKANWNVTKIF